MAREAMAYSEPPTTFEQMAAPFADHEATLTALRAAVRAAVPEARENVSGGLRFGMALYSVDGPNDVVCGIQPSASGCKLFVHGVRQDPTGRLRVQGTGKNARHVKFPPGAAVDAEAARDLIRLAYEARR